MRTKIRENITQISGVETNPFRRYIGDIKLNDFILVLEEEKTKAEKMGYSNLDISIEEDAGIVDIYLYGDRNLTEDERDIEANLKAQDEATKAIETQKDAVKAVQKKLDDIK